MSTDQAVELEDLRTLVAEEVELPPEEVTDDANLLSDLGLDSLSLMEIAALLEKKYQIKISDEETRSLTSLMAIQRVVSAKVEMAQ